MEQQIDNYAVIRDGKLYQKPFLNFEEREVGHIDDAERTLSYYQNNYSDFKKEVEELLAKIDEEQNKGSFLSYLENLRDKMKDIEAVGDFESLYTRINDLEVDINKQIRANRERNLAVKKGFIDELKALNNVSDTTLSVDRVKDIRGKWIRVGAVKKDEQDDLQQQFEAIIEDFFNRHNALMEEEAKLYVELLEESKELAQSEDFSGARKRMIEIQKEWKLLPKIDKSQYVPLFNELREVHDTFFNKASEQYKQEKKQKDKAAFEKGREKKQQCIAEAKELLKNMDSNSIQDLKKVQKNWKGSGRVSKEEGDKLWEEFSSLTDEFFIRKTLEMSVPSKKGEETPDVLKSRMKWLKDSIKHEKRDLKTVEDNMGAFRLNISSNKMKDLFQTRDKSVERRLEIKEEIIGELKKALNVLEKSAK